MKTTQFPNRANQLAGHLHLPPDFDPAASYPALVASTPGSSVKEQIGAIYAQRLCAHGYLVLTFDPSHQGESEGLPRDLEDPAVRVEDIRCALDHLTTLPYVDEHRIGLLGICAGGGYAVHAALTEPRFKAVGTVAASNIGRALRQMMKPPEVLKAVADERTREARGGELRRDPWIPDSLLEAELAGITDPDLLEAVRFYRESPYRHANSTNRLIFSSFGLLLAFDAFHLVPQLLTQPLLVIVGGRKGATGSYEDGETLYSLACTEKEFVVIDGAGHYDLYHKPEYVEPAVERLAAFFSKHLQESAGS